MSFQIVKYMLPLLMWSNIAISEQLRILTSEEPPTNFSYQNTITGTTTDIVYEIQKYINDDTTIEILPWVRAYAYAKEKPNVLIFTAGRTQDRINHGFHFIGPVVTRKHTLFSKKDSLISIHNFEDIIEQQLVVGAMRGDWRSKFFKNKGIKVQEVFSHELNAKKLITDRIDLWALSDLEISMVLKKSPVSMSEVKSAFVFSESPSYLMFSKDTPIEIVNQWRNGFEQIKKSEFFSSKSKKWSKELGLPISYTPSRGFHIKDKE